MGCADKSGHAWRGVENRNKCVGGAPWAGLYLVPVSVRLSQFRPSALAGPVRRTWVRVLTPEPSRVKSESADGAE